MIFALELTILDPKTETLENMKSCDLFQKETTNSLEISKSAVLLNLTTSPKIVTESFLNKSNDIIINSLTNYKPFKQVKKRRFNEFKECYDEYNPQNESYNTINSQLIKRIKNWKINEESSLNSINVEMKY